MNEAASGMEVIQRVVVPFAGMFAIFYFIAIRPQIKTQKEQEKMLQNVKKNDVVVTRGGLFGTIVNMKADVLTLRIDDNVRVDVERSAITRVVNGKLQDKDGQTQESSR